jgi:CubicO group peptidase (beta-lactamase class C family)
MKKILLFSLSFLLSQITPCSAQDPFPKELPDGPNPLITQLDRDVDAAARRFLKHSKTVGVVIGILNNGKTSFYGYGETEKGNRQVPDEHTIFEIGSITKTFTATLLACAVNEGRVKLDDPINKYLPDSAAPFQYQGVPVTLQTLANHTSGLPEMPTNFTGTPEDHEVWTGDPLKDYDYNDMFSFYAHFKLQRKPGQKMDYSNFGVATLAVILERVYGKPYEQLVLEKICDPLGMADTRQNVPPGDIPRVAYGYSMSGNPAMAWHCKSLAGCGCLRSISLMH